MGHSYQVSISSFSIISFKIIKYKLVTIFIPYISSISTNSFVYLRMFIIQGTFFIVFSLGQTIMSYFLLVYSCKLSIPFKTCLCYHTLIIHQSSKFITKQVLQLMMQNKGINILFFLNSDLA
jgi:hypothetical protein